MMLFLRLQKSAYQKDVAQGINLFGQKILKLLSKTEKKREKNMLKLQQQKTR